MKVKAMKVTNASQFGNENDREGWLWRKENEESLISDCGQKLKDGMDEESNWLRGLMIGNIILPSPLQFNDLIIRRTNRTIMTGCWTVIDTQWYQPDGRNGQQYDGNDWSLVVDPAQLLPMAWTQLMKRRLKLWLKPLCRRPVTQYDWRKTQTDSDWRTIEGGRLTGSRWWSRKAGHCRNDYYQPIEGPIEAEPILTVMTLMKKTGLLILLLNDVMKWWYWLLTMMKIY